MAQSDGKNTLWRVSLVIPDKRGRMQTYRFKVNPEEYTLSMPQRSSTLKTKSDIVLEDYGKDIATITFSGTTGFKEFVDTDGKTKTGKDKIDELERMIIAYSDIAGSGSVSKEKMKFRNWTDNKFYKVHLAPQGLKITRSVDEPLLYRYEISLQILGREDEPDRGSLVEPEYGNTVSSGDRYVKSLLGSSSPSGGSLKYERDKNNQRLDNTNEDVRINRSNDNTKAYNPTANGSSIFNPRMTTNGLKGEVDSLALLIGYGDAGVDIK